MLAVGFTQWIPGRWVEHFGSNLGRSRSQCFAKRTFTFQFDRLSDQLCQSLDRLSDHFAKPWPQLNGQLHVQTLNLYPIPGGIYRGTGGSTPAAALRNRIDRPVLLLHLCWQSLGLRAAGRTDAGVHARGQVISFRLPELHMTPLQVLRGINGKLGSAASDIRVVECAVVDPGEALNPKHETLSSKAHAPLIGIELISSSLKPY